MRTGFEQVKMLSGSTADPDFIGEITYLIYNHHEKIVAIDTIRAYYIAYKYQVEVDIVLPPTMQLQEAHDIGESLQTKIESLDVVERAFVHLDYESEHSAAMEHKWQKQVSDKLAEQKKANK